MPETGTVVGLAIAGVAVIGAAVALGVALSSKSGSPGGGGTTTTVVKTVPQAPPPYYWDYPVFVGNAGYYGGYSRRGGGHGRDRHHH